MKLPEGAVFTYITPDALPNAERILDMLEDTAQGIMQMKNCLAQGDMGNLCVKSQVAGFNLKTLSEELAVMISS